MLPRVMILFGVTKPGLCLQTPREVGAFGQPRPTDPPTHKIGEHQKTPHFVPKTPPFWRTMYQTPPPPTKMYQKTPEMYQKTPRGGFLVHFGGCAGGGLVHFGGFLGI